MIDVKKAASKLVEYLNMCGSPSETNLSMNHRDDHDHYKPMYRATALFHAPTHPYIDEVLGGEKPTKDQASEIMCLAHPYFVHVLKTDPDLFDSMWEHFTEAWSE